MKNALLVLFLAGAVSFTVAHPFVTNGTGILRNGETEIVLSAGTDFVEDGDGNIGLSVDYGIGDRLQIGVGNGFRIQRNLTANREFIVPDLSMKFAVRPDFIAIKAYSSLNGEEFGALMLYTITMKKMGTELNLDLGFASDGDEYNAFDWRYSIVQPFNKLFIGLEIFGKAAHNIEKDLRKPFWNYGIGYGYGRNFKVSLAFGGSFVSNDDLKLSLGITRILNKVE